MEKIRQEVCLELSLSTFSVFLFLSKTVRFPDKKNWDFALSFLALLSSCFPGHSFIQTEAFVHSIWSRTEGKYYYSLMFWADTDQASLCSAPAGFHVKLFPCSEGLAVPFFSTVIWVLSLGRAGLRAVLLKERSLPASDWLAQLKSRCFVWGRRVLRLWLAFRVRRGKAAVRSGPSLWTESSTEFRN